MKPYQVHASLLLFCFAWCIHGGGAVLFSSLPRSLLVTASPAPGQVLKAGEDNINVTWGQNQSSLSFAYVKLKLCYAPISQTDRKWRKTKDDLNKDKTCQFTIVNRPYQINNQSFKWTIERDIPTATYFVRAYAYNSAGEEVAYGQTTNSNKRENLFEIEGISGRPVSLDIAAVCFSTFAWTSIVVFFLDFINLADSLWSSHF